MDASPWSPFGLGDVLRPWACVHGSVDGFSGVSIVRHGWSGGHDGTNRQHSAARESAPGLVRAQRREGIRSSGGPRGPVACQQGRRDQHSRRPQEGPPVRRLRLEQKRRKSLSRKVRGNQPSRDSHRQHAGNAPEGLPDDLDRRRAERLAYPKLVLSLPNRVRDDSVDPDRRQQQGGRAEANQHPHQEALTRHRTRQVIVERLDLCDRLGGVKLGQQLANRCWRGAAAGENQRDGPAARLPIGQVGVRLWLRH